MSTSPQRVRRSAQFATEAHREAVALAEADQRSDDMEFVEAISVLAGMDPSALR